MRLYGMRRLIVVLAITALVASACGDSEGGAQTLPTTTSVPTDTTPTTDPGQAPQGEFVRADLPRARGDFDLVADLVAADTAFALDLYRSLSSEDENLFFSPYSIATALGMALAGADGPTAAEIAAALNAPGVEEYHAARNALGLILEAADFAVVGENEPPPLVFRSANALYGQRGFPFNQPFLDELATNYGAGMRIVDYVGDPGAARETINDWVEDQTENRIIDLVPEGVITTDTRLTLVNAVYFLANWLHEFNPELTTDGTFTTPAGVVTAPMMATSIRTNYASGPGYQAIALPYVGDASMVIIMPDGDLSDFVASLDATAYRAIRDGISDHQVELSMPRFEFRSTIPLKESLKGLGIELAFQPPLGDGGADFTGMTDDRILFLQDAVHQAFVSVDEKGTEAAAATALVAGITSAPPPAELTLDRPFLFFIEQASTGEILFAGQVADPTQQ